MADGSRSGRLRHLTYFKTKGWGWYYLSSILDDYSRYVIAWKLCGTMKAKDVTDTLDQALKASGYHDKATMPRLLSVCEADGAKRRHNGSSYVAEELADFLKGKGMGHVRGRPYHP